MKSYYAYIRVSTTRQGETGVPLQEQRIAIDRYARLRRLSVAQWFEEHQTASRRGCQRFAELLMGLKSGEVAGVIMHRIDRSVRNLRD